GDEDGDAVSNDTLNNYANAFSQDETDIANLQAAVATLRGKRPCDRNLDDVESALLDAHEGVNKNKQLLNKLLAERATSTGSVSKKRYGSGSPQAHQLEDALAALVGSSNR